MKNKRAVWISSYCVYGGIIHQNAVWILERTKPEQITAVVYFCQ